MTLSSIALSATIVYNVCFYFGFGLLGVIPHKKHAFFMLVSNFMLLVMSIVCSALYYLLYNFVLVPLECKELSLFAMTVIVLLVDFVAMMVLKALSKENYYHYEKNFLFVVHAIVTLGMVFVSNVTAMFTEFLFSVVMQFVGLLVVNLLFFALNGRINNKFMPEHIRALPPQLILMAVLALVGFLLTGIVM